MIKNIIKKIYFRIWYLFLKTKDARVTSVAEEEEEIHSELKEDNDTETLNVSIAEALGNRDGIVTIISDDGFFESGLILSQLAKKHKLRVTIAGAVSIIKPHLQEWKKIVSENFVELVNHSYSHIGMREDGPIGKNRDRLYYEIIAAKLWFEKHFLKNQITFVCPENMMSDAGYKIIKEKNIFAVRKGNRGYNSLKPEEGIECGDWYNLMVQGIGDKDVDTATRNSWVNVAAQNRKWLIEMWHNVAKEDDGLYQTILATEAEEHLKYIAEKQSENSIWVATFTDAVKYIRERQITEVKAHLCKGKILVSATMGGKLSKDIFNYPLTVQIQVPQELQKSSFFIGEKKLQINKQGNILMEIIPDSGMKEILIEK